MSDLHKVAVLRAKRLTSRVIAEPTTKGSLFLRTEVAFVFVLKPQAGPAQSLFYSTLLTDDTAL